MPNNSLSRLRKLQAEARALFNEEVAGDAEERFSARWHHFAHFWVLVYRSFIRNRCLVRAAALAFTTLLALVPLLAVVMSVSTAFLRDQQWRIDYWVTVGIARVAPQLDLIEADEGGRAQVVTAIQEYIDNFRSGTLGITALLVLMFVAISLLTTIEAALNDMWGVSQGRGVFSSIIQYWAVLTLGPVLLLMAFGLTTGQQVQVIQGWIQRVPLLGSLLFYFLPFIILSVLCALFYLLMPNTKVDWRAALIGGLVGGCLLQLNSNLNVMYVSRVVTYRQIYGGLAVVPLFLLGLYFSWSILLLGAQVAYAFQNRRAYMQEKQAERINERGREFIALRLMTYIAHAFKTGGSPSTTLKMAGDLAIPLRLVCQVLGVLKEVNLIVEVTGKDKSTAYSPARPLDHITIKDILFSLRCGVGNELATINDDACGVVRSEFEKIEQIEKQAARLVTLDDLVDRIPPPAPAPSAPACARL